MGVPSVIEDYIFGKKVRGLRKVLFSTKLECYESKDLPDFDIVFCIFLMKIR